MVGEKLNFGRKSWNFLGLFTDETEAANRCISPRYFYVSIQINSDEPVPLQPEFPFIFPAQIEESEG